MDKLEQKLTMQEYNDEPVVYCKHCLSLAIRTSDGIDYCEKCGNTEMGESHIVDWEKLYGQRYGGSYLEINK